MICLNSAGNLVRFEVGKWRGNSKVFLLRPLEDNVSRGNTGKHGCQSEPCPSTRAQRTERPVARNGYYLRRVRTVSGRELPDTVRICTWNHGATLPQERQAATKVQCAGKSLQRWVELCRPSNGRGQRTDPWPQYAFKVSMFNVSCNSH